MQMGAAAAPAASTTAVAGATGGGAAGAASPELLAALKSLSGVLGQLVASLGASSLGGGPMGKGSPAQSPSQSPMQLTPGKFGGGPTATDLLGTSIASTGFQDVEREQVSVQLEPGAAHVGSNLQRLASASDMRISRLTQALGADANRNGQLNAVDVQKLTMERANNANLHSLATKVAQYGPRLTDAEATGIMRIITRANQTGSFEAATLGRAIFDIEARLAGVPAATVSAAGHAFDRLAGFDEGLGRASKELAMSANQTGQLDGLRLQQIGTLAIEIRSANAALKATLDQVRSNPTGSAALVAKLDAAAAATSPAAFTRALA